MSILSRIDKLEISMRPVAPPLAEYEQALENMSKRLYMALYEFLGAQKYAELRDLLVADNPQHGDPYYYRHLMYSGYGDEYITYAEAQIRNIIQWPGFANTPEQEAKDTEIIEQWWRAHGIDREVHRQETIKEWKEHLAQLSDEDCTFRLEEDMEDIVMESSKRSNCA